MNYSKQKNFHKLFFDFFKDIHEGNQQDLTWNFFNQEHDTDNNMATVMESKRTMHIITFFMCVLIYSVLLLQFVKKVETEGKEK